MRLTIAITSLSISLDDCFAAIPGCWPGRALPTSGYPQPGRPRSGCALGPFVPHAAHAPMRVSRTASRRLRRSSHTRLQQPASRSASGRVLSPPYAAVRPNARSMGGAWSACVTPGQRRTRYARSSGLLPSRARPRPSSPSASAGGKDPTATVAWLPPHVTGYRLRAASPAATTWQRLPEAVSGPRQPLLQPEPASSTRERLRAPGSPPDAACRPGHRRT